MDRVWEHQCRLQFITQKQRNEEVEEKRTEGWLRRRKQALLREYDVTNAPAQGREEKNIEMPGQGAATAAPGYVK